MSKRERRFLQSDVTVMPGESPKITGYAAVFGKRSHNLGGFVEVVDPGAFTDCLQTNPDIVGCINHDENLVLGRTSAGTMRVFADEVGLRYEIDPPGTTYSNDLLISMKRKDIKGSSFGFYCVKDKFTYDSVAKVDVRTILKADLFDTSVVTNGAYPDASSEARALFPDDRGKLPEAITEKLAELRTIQRKEKRGRNVMAAVSSSKWAILPEKLETICAFLNAWSEGNTVSKAEVQAGLMGYEDDEFSEENESPVAQIKVYGSIGQKMNMMTEFSGGCSCESLTKSFRAALADDSVTSIVFDVDSPGGTVTGVPELAAEILAARGKKPIIAVANGMAASAALWIATAADKFYCIPSGDVGSIGVYMTHQDVSQAMDKAGVKMTFIKAGKFKTDGNPYEPASPEFLADAQKGVDEFYEMFVAGVAAGRNVSEAKVKSDFGQGRMLMAKDALAAGLIDGIQTLDAVVAGLSKTDSSFGGTQMSAAKISETGCTCMCSQCVGGDHPNCSGPTNGTCDYDGDKDAPDDNNDGQQASVVAIMDSGCNCPCPQCMAGDHKDCTGLPGACDKDGDADAPDDNNDGQQASIVAKTVIETCGCQCPECLDGDHDDCTGLEDGCDFDDDDEDFDDDDTLAEAEANANALAKVKVMQMSQ